MKILVWAALCFLALGKLDASSIKPHKIDLLLEECIKNNATTSGMNICTKESEKEWDAEMNKVYSMLLSKLNSTGQKNLKLSQRVWLKFRDEEFRFLSVFYGSLGGTMYSNIHFGSRLEIVKRRALELQSYLADVQ